MDSMVITALFGGTIVFLLGFIVGRIQELQACRQMLEELNDRHTEDINKLKAMYEKHNNNITCDVSDGHDSSERVPIHTA